MLHTRMFQLFSRGCCFALFEGVVGSWVTCAVAVAAVGVESLALALGLALGLVGEWECGGGGGGGTEDWDPLAGSCCEEG